MPSVTRKIKVLSILRKNSEKQKLNFSGSVPFHIKSNFFLKYFDHDVNSFFTFTEHLTGNFSYKTDSYKRNKLFVEK